MTALRWVVLLVAAVGGGLLGEAAWRGAVETRASRPPPDWQEVAPDVPVRLGSLMGRVPPDPDAWNLGFWRTLWPDDPHLRSGPAPIRATVRLPEDGQLELWTSLPRQPGGDGGVGLVLERVGEPSARVVQRSRTGRRALDCGAVLPAPGDLPVPVRIEPLPGGVEVEVAGSRVQCGAALSQAGPAIRAGLRRVQLVDVEVGQVPFPSPGPHLRPLWWLAGGAAALALVGLELWAGASAAVLLWTTAPLLLAGALLGADVRTFAETARIGWMPVAWLAAIFPAAVTALGKGVHHLARWLREGDGRDWPLAAPVAAAVPSALAIAAAPGAWGTALAGAVAAVAAGAASLAAVAAYGALGSPRPRRAAAVSVAVASAAACGVGLAAPLHRLAPALAGAAVLALGALVWANANAARVRAYNLTCLLLSLGLVAATEGSVRYTKAGVAWSDVGSRTRPDDIYGWVPQATETFALLEEGAHTTYPDKGYPVAIAPREGRVRVVSMGGSTTGGAFQNDDLDEFYPARIQEAFGPSVQVLNQGVGGWTTWHVRRYLADHLEALDPDVLTLYVGHNDLLTPVPVPYAQLYDAWRGPAVGQQLARFLHRFRLYQGLRYLLSAVRPAARRVAVPVEDARENLRVVSTQVTARGGRVILASEGLAPDPGPLAGYNAMMVELADELEGVSYLPVAERLHAWDGDRVFLDDCHLTEAGHRLVADAFIAELRRLGVVEGADDRP